MAASDWCGSILWPPTIAEPGQALPTRREPFKIDEKLIEIPQGLDPELWQIDDDLLREATALRQQLAGGSPVASFIGRLIVIKTFDAIVIGAGHFFSSLAFL
jgi:hypothetical protein